MIMDWQRTLITAFVSLGGSAVFLAVVAWLLKSALTEWLARETKAFEMRLKANADVEIEKLKNSLQIIATEHQVRFSKMHERRADVIEELYGKLTDVYLEGRNFVLTSENDPTPNKAKEFANLREKLGELFLFLEHRRIFLPKSVCDPLDQHFQQINLTVLKAGIFGRIEHPREHTAQQIEDAFTKAYKDFEIEIPAARKALETEFRKMLGAESD